MMKRLLHWKGWEVVGDIFLIGCGVLTIYALMAIMSGCTIAPTQRGWNPTKYEMEMLVGQTTLNAIHIYQQALEAHAKELALKKLNDPQRKY